MNEIDKNREPWEIISLIAAVWLGCFGLDWGWLAFLYDGFAGVWLGSCLDFLGVWLLFWRGLGLHGF